MAKRNRRTHSPAFKARGHSRRSRATRRWQLAQQFDVNPDQIADWKKQLQQRVADVSESHRATRRFKEHFDSIFDIHPWHRLYHVLTAGLAQYCAYVVDLHIYRARHNRPLFMPDAFHDSFARQHLVGVFY